MSKADTTVTNGSDTDITDGPTELATLGNLIKIDGVTAILLAGIALYNIFELIRIDNFHARSSVLGLVIVSVSILFGVYYTKKMVSTIKQRNLLRHEQSLVIQSDARVEPK